MRCKLRPIFKDIALTFITQAIVLVSFFIIYRLIGRNFGQDGLGRFCLVKRVVAFLSPLLFLGLGVGLPRYIAMSRTKNQRSSYIKTGILLISIFAFMFLIFINLFKDYFAKTFFGSTDYTILILPFSFLLSGSVLHALIYSYFRGRLWVKTFNSVQVINFALIPIVILILFKNITIEKLIIVIGITTFAVALIFFLFHIREILSPLGKWQFKNSLKELFIYSLPRVPGDFALAGLFSLGPILAAHFASIQEVGYLSISLSLLNTAAITISPLSTILLPKVGTAIIEGREETVRENLDFLVGAVLQCFIFVSVQLLIFTDVIIHYWLGSDFSEAVPVTRIVFASITFYAFYMAVRSILDAAEVKPLNAINLFISLSIFFLGTGILLFFKFFSPIISLSASFTFGVMCLGILTYASIRRIYPKRVKKDFNCLMVAVLVSFLLGSIAMLCKSFISCSFYCLFGFEAFISVIYLSILWLLKTEWLRQLPEKIKIEIRNS